MEVVHRAARVEVRKCLNLPRNFKDLTCYSTTRITIKVILGYLTGRAVRPLKAASPDLRVAVLIGAVSDYGIEMDSRYADLIQAADGVLVKSSAGGCIGAGASPAAG